MKNNLTMRNFLELKGSLVYLKRLDKVHAAEYAQSVMSTCVETMILTSTGTAFSKSGIEEFVDEISSDKSRVDFLIYTNSSDELVGDVAINDICRNSRSAGIRVAIDKNENFNKGYGSEALMLALHYGFGMLNLHRIELEVLTINERAVHVYEKLGFRKEGIKRDGYFFGHRYFDVVTMSVLEEEFRARYIENNDTIEGLLK